VDQGVIKERAAALRSLGREKRRDFYRSCLGNHFETLVEGWHQREYKLMRGTTDNYIPVIFTTSEDLRGQMVTLVLEEWDSENISGRLKEDIHVEKEGHQA
jgi:tRNA A37 methylthiotransferase MiaB